MNPAPPGMTIVRVPMTEFYDNTPARVTRGGGVSSNSERAKQVKLPRKTRPASGPAKLARRAPFSAGDAAAVGRHRRRGMPPVRGGVAGVSVFGVSVTAGLRGSPGGGALSG